MTVAILALGLLLGYGLARAIRPPRPVVVLRREPVAWIEFNGVRERIDWTPAQVSALLDRLAAAERERRTLIGLLSDKRIDEVSERRLRVVEGRQ